MLHRRQALGRDLHKHVSLAPARSDTNLRFPWGRRAYHGHMIT